MAQLVEQPAFNRWGDVSPLKVRVLLGAHHKIKSRIDADLRNCKT